MIVFGFSLVTLQPSVTTDKHKNNCEQDEDAEYRQNQRQVKKEKMDSLDRKLRAAIIAIIQPQVVNTRKRGSGNCGKRYCE